MLLDQVFTPGRAKPEADQPRPRATEAAPASVQHRGRNEKALHAEFLALAYKDDRELERQAEAILKADGDPSRQVALLRALFDTDRRRSLPFFVQAITSLPDRSRPEGVSVPAFAMDYLCKRVDEPVVRLTLERLAWGRDQAVPVGLRRVAADALIATATASEIERYSAYPDFRRPARQDATGDGKGEP